MTPNPPYSLRVELSGDLAEILSFAATDAREFPARVNASGTKGGDVRVLGMLSLVAGMRNQLDLLLHG